jgi:hypothetical protein
MAKATGSAKNSDSKKESSHSIKILGAIFLASIIHFSPYFCIFMQSLGEPLEADFSSNVNHVDIFEEGTVSMFFLSYPMFFSDYAAYTGKIFWFK